jgi:hypothetical protein
MIFSIVLVFLIIFFIQELDYREKKSLIKKIADRAFGDGKRIGEIHARMAFEKSLVDIKLKIEEVGVSPQYPDRIVYQMVAFDRIDKPYIGFATDEEASRISADWYDVSKIRGIK